MISNSARISPTAKIWDMTQIREHAVVGDFTVVGSFVYIDAHVEIGRNCKIQSKALIYDPAIIHNGVFIGPGAILTNDRIPRAVKIDGQIKAQEDWTKVGVEIFEGASIGSGAICIAPAKIGKWAMVGAGSVVTKDVKDYALVVGNPARQIGWVGPSGVPLKRLSDSIFECPKTLTRFELINSHLHEMISE